MKNAGAQAFRLRAPWFLVQRSPGSVFPVGAAPQSGYQVTGSAWSTEPPPVGSSWPRTLCRWGLRPVHGFHARLL